MLLTLFMHTLTKSIDSLIKNTRKPVIICLSRPLFLKWVDIKKENPLSQAGLSIQFDSKLKIDARYVLSMRATNPVQVLNGKRYC